ncbi:MAG: DUF3137 domain-containing protein [Lachnospiraceae bacterium]|nr:DUF3137 domain-containing protein [Lachnospiraceae bacterium]
MSESYGTKKVWQILSEIRERKDKMEICKKLEVIFIAALVLFLIIATVHYVKYDMRKFGIYMTFFVISVVVALFFARQEVLQREAIKELLGRNVIRDIIAEEVQLIEYDPVFDINRELKNMCTILPGYNYSKANDYIRGKYKGAEFTYFDLHLRDGVEQAQHDAFKGQVIRLVLKKDLGITIKFKKKDNPRSDVRKIETIKNAIGAFSAGKYETEIKVGHERFDGFYSVMTNDEEKALALLTEERLNRISEMMQLACSYTNVEFSGKNVFITIDNNIDAFSNNASIYDERSLENACELYRNDLKQILEIMEKMIVNEELF